MHNEYKRHTEDQIRAIQSFIEALDVRRDWCDGTLEGGCIHGLGQEVGTQKDGLCICEEPLYGRQLVRRAIAASSGHV